VPYGPMILFFDEPNLYFDQSLRHKITNFKFDEHGTFWDSSVWCSFLIPISNQFFKKIIFLKARNIKLSVNIFCSKIEHLPAPKNDSKTVSFSLWAGSYFKRASYMKNLFSQLANLASPGFSCSNKFSLWRITKFWLFENRIGKSKTR